MHFAYIRILSLTEFEFEFELKLNLNLHVQCAVLCALFFYKHYKPPCVSLPLSLSLCAVPWETWNLGVGVGVRMSGVRVWLRLALGARRSGMSAVTS
jgi:hypothetical protein